MFLTFILIQDLTGEYEDRNFIVTRGDSRIAITLPRTEHTKKLNRQSRFLVDDFAGNGMLSFALTKPLKVGHTYDSENGIYKFVLQEVNSTDFDNFELGIADYYKYFPRDIESERFWEEAPGEITDPDTGKKRWL